MKHCNVIHFKKKKQDMKSHLAQSSIDAAVKRQTLLTQYFTQLTTWINNSVISTATTQPAIELHVLESYYV